MKLLVDQLHQVRMSALRAQQILILFLQVVFLCYLAVCVSLSALKFALRCLFCCVLFSLRAQKILILLQVVTSKLTALLCTLLSRSLSLFLSLSVIVCLSLSLKCFIARVLVEIKARARIFYLQERALRCEPNNAGRGGGSWGAMSALRQSSCTTAY
jgi:hypothetical protein